MAFYKVKIYEPAVSRLIGGNSEARIRYSICHARQDQSENGILFIEWSAGLWRFEDGVCPDFYSDLFDENGSFFPTRAEIVEEVPSAERMAPDVFAPWSGQFKYPNVLYETWDNDHLVAVTRDRISDRQIRVVKPISISKLEEQDAHIAYANSGGVGCWINGQPVNLASESAFPVWRWNEAEQRYLDALFFDTCWDAVYA